MLDFLVRGKVINYEISREEKMGTPKTSHSPAVTFTDAQGELRCSPRVPVLCRLTYSGVSEGTLIVGEGGVVDLSQEGCGIQGNRSVRTGMLLTLCMYFIDSERPIILEEVRVVWVEGERFGVQSLSIRDTEQERLHRVMERELNKSSHDEGKDSSHLHLYG